MKLNKAIKQARNLPISSLLVFTQNSSLLLLPVALTVNEVHIVKVGGIDGVYRAGDGERGIARGAVLDGVDNGVPNRLVGNVGNAGVKLALNTLFAKVGDLVQILRAASKGSGDLVAAALFELLCYRQESAESEDEAGEVVQRHAVEVDRVLQGAVTDGKAGDILGQGCPAGTIFPNGVGEAHEVCVNHVGVELANLGFGKTELVESAVLIRVGDNICLLDKLLALFKLRGNVEVKLDGIFAGPAVKLQHGLFLIDKLAAANHQHIRAVLGENTGASRACNDVRKVEHLDAGERALYAGLAPCGGCALGFLVRADKRHGDNGLAHFAGFPLFAGADHAAGCAAGKGALFKVKCVVAADNVHHFLLVLRHGKHGVLRAVLGIRQGGGKLVELILIVNVEGDITAVFGAVLEERAVERVIYADCAHHTGNGELCARVAGHVKAVGLHTGKCYIAGGGCARNIIAAQLAYLGGDRGARREHGRDCGSLQDLFVLKNQAHCGFALFENGYVHGRGERVILVAGVFELRLSALVGDKDGGNRLDAVLLRQVFKNNLSLLGFLF